VRSRYVSLSEAVEAEAVRQRWSEVSERKSEDDGGIDDVEMRRENGLRVRVSVGMGLRRRPRSCLERMMLSNRVMEAKVGVMAVEEEVDIGAGGVRSRSEMNSLKAVAGALVLAMQPKKRGRNQKLTLRLLKPIDIVSVFTRQTPQKFIHVEAVDHPIFPLFHRRTLHVLPVGVEQAGETPCKCGTHLVRIESRWTDDEQLLCTPAVHRSATS
jgi:hypothetical protein